MGIQRRAILNRSRGLSAVAFAGAALGPAAVACGPAQGQPGTPAEGQAQTPAGNPVKGGSYTEAVFGDAKTMQPLLSTDAPSNSFIGLHYNAPLLRRNEETLELDTKYGTAESFQVAPDGLSVTYKLKPNLQWSDGRPITSADYKFTYDKMLDPKVDYPYRNNYREFEGLTAPDERTLVFTLKEAFCPAIDQSNLNPIPKHIFENQDINDGPLNQKPTVGSGPWLLQEWNKDSHAVFVANDKFFLGRPNLDRWVYRIVADQNVIYAMVKAQEVDSGTVKAEDWEEVKTLKHLQPFSYYPVAAAWTYIGFNMRRDELKDVRVRQALSYAMDRQKMVDRIRLGHAKPLNSIYASSTWAYTDDVPKTNFDPAKAKQLLDAAGWRAPANDPNGTRVKDGKPLKMRLFYNAGNKEREQAATVAQQYAKAIGVELDVIGEEWNAYLNRVNQTRDMEMYTLGWNSSFEPNGMRNIWLSDGGQNATGFSNPQVDELFPKAGTVPGCSQAERKRIYGEIQKLISGEQPYIFLWEGELLAAVNNRLVVNKLSKIGFGYRPWEWYSKTGK